MTRRLILGVTGIRSEYDIMSSVFRAIASDRRLTLQLVVMGAHLSEDFGLTVRDIEADGFAIADRIHSLISSDADAGRVKGLAIQLQGLIQTIDRLKPDMLLVLGDREEAINTALAGAYLNIPVAHIGGGDRVVGNVDDQVRHAATKLAHIHLATNRDSARRIARMGEQAFRIFNVGNPGLDRLVAVPKLSRAQLSKRLGLDLSSGPYLMVIQHALSSEISQSYAQMQTTLAAIRELALPTVVVYPNSDAGSQQIIRAIHELEGLPFIHVAKNIPRLEFVNLMRQASCLVGNSSAGILEAPLLKLPVVNVGQRQRGRLHADNVQFVAHDRRAIVRAVTKAVFDERYRARVRRCANPYGDGRSSQQIAKILATIQLDRRLLIKDMTY